MNRLKEAVANHYMKNDENALKKSTRLVSVRLDIDVLAQVEFVGKKLGLNRTQVMHLLLDEASHDAMLEIARLQTEGKDEKEFEEEVLSSWREVQSIETQYEHSKETE